MSHDCIKKLNISQVDTLFANGSYPVEFLIYYSHSIPIERIRSSLQKLVSPFWPLFGIYDAGVIHFDSYDESHYLDEVVLDEVFKPGKINDPVPSELKRLFFLKVIQYQNGTVLIPKQNHLAGDGYSYFFFLSALAALCRDHDNPVKQRLAGRVYRSLHERTTLKGFQYKQLDIEPLGHGKNLSVEFERVPKTSVRSMIRDIKRESNRTVSTNDILCAMVLKKSIEIQIDAFVQNIRLTMPMDVRTQVKEYGPAFFGNALQFHEIDFKSREVRESDISAIALTIRENIPVIDRENYLKYLNLLEDYISNGRMDKLRPYDPEKGCLVTNLSRMPTDRLDFGTGNPDFIVPLTIGKNSVAILADREDFVLRLAY
jgi:hypothetical protein